VIPFLLTFRKGCERIVMPPKRQSPNFDDWVLLSVG
jgi:hypothetical protein